ncbi:hypothetical protein GPJ56_001137 [Histomonas meleagridis]|uniref:uncharacterized protein n=1 Tax=Histomonas meleagridis TaxID=135588 RepID=UPI003559A449|nr:hypothetical protein GPJ56_001137 [Histomonas meleagridis]KAH0800352.1 hypothetical protein GO595_006763 [Histomonas meleagridis]
MLFIFSWCLLRNPVQSKYGTIPNSASKKSVPNTCICTEKYCVYGENYLDAIIKYIQMQISNANDKSEERIVKDFIDVYTKILMLKNELPNSNSLAILTPINTGKIIEIIKSYIFNSPENLNQHNEEPTTSDVEDTSGKNHRIKLDLSKIPKFYRRVIDIITQEDNSVSHKHTPKFKKGAIRTEKKLIIYPIYDKILGQESHKVDIVKKIAPLKSYGEILKKATNANEEHEDRIVKDFIYVYTSLLNLKNNLETSNTVFHTITILSTDKIMGVIKKYFNKNENSPEETNDTNSAVKLDLSKISKFYRRVVDVITKVKEQEENSDIIEWGKIITDWYEYKYQATRIEHDTEVICSIDELLDPKLREKCSGINRSDNSKGNTIVKSIKKKETVRGYSGFLTPRNNEMSEEANRVVIAVI